MNRCEKLMRTAVSGILVAGLGCTIVGCQGQSTQTNARSTPASSSQKQLHEQRGLSTQQNGMYAAETGDRFYSCVDEPIDLNTEEYAARSENGFISTASRPLSTFSSDVDTASYCNLRRMINEGRTADEVPSGAVRIEEMLNYFDYSYASPKGDDLFGVDVEMGACPWNKDTALLVMGFSTADEAKVTRGRNLVFLIDSSGSMSSSDKLPLLQDSFSVLAGELGADDRVSIVTYSGSEKVLARGVPGNDRQRIMEAIDGIEAHGSTNGEAGLTMAYNLAEQYFIEGGVNRIILASDGDLNVGMTSTSDLNDYVSEKRKTGIYLSVLGFGTGNYKDTKMEVLADNGNGNYHYIDCKEEAMRVFDEKLSSNLAPLADDVKLQVEFNPAQVKAYRLIGYENRAMADADFSNEAADAGEVGPNNQFTVAYEIVPTDSAMEIDAPQLKYENNSASGVSSDEWLTCSMRYKMIDGCSAEQKACVSEKDYGNRPSADWAFAASVIECGMLLCDSEYAGDATWKGAVSLAESSAGNDARRSEFVSLMKGL